MPAHSEVNTLLAEIEPKVPRELQQHLNAREGAAILCQKLPQLFKPDQIVHLSTEQRAWELIGLYYFNQDKPRNFEALSIFLTLYRHMLEGQEKLGQRVHKGMPLLWRVNAKP